MRLHFFWRALIVLSLSISFATAGEKPHSVAGRILVKSKTRISDADFANRINTHGGLQRRTIRHSNVRVVTISPEKTEAVLTALRNDPDIEFAEPDYIATAASVPNDAYVVSGSEWHLPKIQAAQAWDITTGNSSVIIAVIDSGINAAHPDLAGRVLPGYDFAWGDSDPNDEFGHGTAVTGTIVAAGNNGIGVAGVAYGCSVLPIKVMGASGSAAYSTIAQGIEYAVNHGARVINLSLAGDSPSATLQDAINYAWSNNVVVVAAAGNNANSVPQYPAACEHVIAVAATASDDSRASFSSYGSYVTLAAPGDGIWTTTRDLSNPYAPWRGTSFASPVVAGVAALIASANPSLSNTRIADILNQTADDLGWAGYDTSFGFGRVNASRAISAANALPGAVPLAPAPTPGVNPTNAPTAPLPVTLTNLLPAAKGSYAGLVANTNGVTPESSGYFTLTVRASGAFSGKLSLGAKRYGFSGQFNPNGDATVSVPRKLLAPITVTLHLDLTNGTDQITGRVSDGSWTSELTGDRNVFNARLNPAPHAGTRSFILERVNESMTAVTGSGKISAAGAARIRGKLNDGRAVNAASTLAKNGDCPFYLSLNRGSEVIIGWLNFPAVPSPTASGTVLWVKNGTNGFAATLQAASAQ